LSIEVPKNNGKKIEKVVFDKEATIGLVKSSCWTHPAPIQAATPSSAMAFPAAEVAELLLLMLATGDASGNFHMDKAVQ
jgi:hypothetical protein